MLREFGAKGIKVQEVVSLDPEMLQFLKYVRSIHPWRGCRANLRDSKPIYGLIFLFRWKEPEADTQEAICPDDVWFANQVGVTISNRRCKRLLANLPPELQDRA